MFEFIFWAALMYHAFAVLEYFNMRHKGYSKAYCQDTVTRKYYGN